MIELLVMQFCIVLANGSYDCNWQLELNNNYSLISKQQKDWALLIYFTSADRWHESSENVLWRNITKAMEFRNE